MTEGEIYRVGDTDDAQPRPVSEVEDSQSTATPGFRRKKIPLLSFTQRWIPWSDLKPFLKDFSLAMIIQAPVWWYLKGFVPIIITLTYALARMPSGVRKKYPTFQALSHITVYLVISPIVAGLLLFAFKVQMNFFTIWVFYSLMGAIIVDLSAIILGLNLIEFFLKAGYAVFWIETIFMELLLAKICWVSSASTTIILLLILVWIWLIVRRFFSISVIAFCLMFTLASPQLFMMSIGINNNLDTKAVKNDPVITPVLLFNMNDKDAGADTTQIMTASKHVRKLAVDGSERFLFISFCADKEELKKGLPSVLTVDLEQPRHRAPGQSVVTARPFAEFVYGQARDILYDPDNNVLYATIYFKGEVVALSVPDLRPLHTIKTGLSGAHNLALDRELKHLYIGHESGVITVASTDPGDQYEILFEISAPGNTQEMVFDPKDHVVYMPSLTPYQLVAVSSVTRKVEWARFTPISLWGIAFDATERRIYTAHFILGVIRAWDPDTFNILKNYHTGTGVRAIEVDPARRLLYAGNFCNGKILVLDLDSGKILYSRFIGKKIRGILITPKTRRVFVSSSLGVFEIHPEAIKRGQ